MRKDLTPYTTVKEPFVYEQVIKKSKFFGRLFPVKSMEEAQGHIDACKKEFWDASHNCSAVVIGPDAMYTRCSDDGEPQGTAGVPMLDALKKNEITNVLAVVTRYFGGTLLGAGGLVRAYSSSVSEAVRLAPKLRYLPVQEFSIRIPFKLWGRGETGLRTAGFHFGEIQYLEDVRLQIYTDIGDEHQLYALLSELSAGNIVPEEKEQTYLVLDI